MSTRRSSRRKEHLKRKRLAQRRREKRQRKGQKIGPMVTPPDPSSTRSLMRAGLWRSMRDFAAQRAAVIAENMAGASGPRPLGRKGKPKQPKGHHS